MSSKALFGKFIIKINNNDILLVNLIQFLFKKKIENGDPLQPNDDEESEHDPNESEDSESEEE